MLKDEGFIADYTVHERKPQSEITVGSSTARTASPVITGIKRVSKPACAATCTCATSRACSAAWASPSSPPPGAHGATREARKQNVGGELHLHGLLAFDGLEPGS